MTGMWSRVCFAASHTRKGAAMKTWAAFSLAFLGSMACIMSASAQTTWIVDMNGGGDFLAIQECIDDPRVIDGDICLVNPGTYVENIRFGGKALALIGAAGPEVTVLDGNASGSVVTLENVAVEGAVLAGLTIRNGRADMGGGVFCAASHLRIENCIVEQNYGRFYGGGIYGSEDSSLVVDACKIRQNTTRYGNGCGIYCSGSTITNCEVIGNSLEYKEEKNFSNPGGGGGINCAGCTISGCIVQGNYGTTGGGISCSESQIVNSQILENRAGDMIGGGILCRDSNLVSHCVISGNHASHSGGAVFDFGRSEIRNCLVTANSAIWGGGIFGGSTTVINSTFSLNQAYYGGAVYLEWASSSLHIANSILWGDSAFIEGPEISISGGAISVVYSDVQGGWPGEGNVDSDPLFVSGPSGAYYLSHTAAGQSEPSPCVDTGDPATDPWGWEAFTTRTDQEFDVGIVDMGYHYPRLCSDQDDDGYSIQGGACGPIDCDDSRPEVNPGSAEGPHGDPSCTDSLDNDCDGLSDSQDPGCKPEGGYSAAANAEASTYGEQAVTVSGLVNAFALLALPAIAVVLAGIVRRKK